MQRTTAQAERNWLRNSLEEVTHDIESNYRIASERALSVPSETLNDVETLSTHLRQNKVPGARTFFAIRYDDNRAEWGFFDPEGLEKTPENEDEVETVKLATVSWHVAHKWNRVMPQPTLFVDEREPQHRVILRPVVDASMHVVGTVGVVLDPKVSRTAMLNIVKQSVRQRTDNATLMIGERFPKMSGGRDFITQPLGFVFTNWRAGIRDSCESPEEVAAIEFRHNAMWTGGAFIVLLGAIALAVGAVARQMRLSQMKSEFVSNVSHELRTPLSSIRVFGEYMRLGRVTQPEKVREYGEYIEAESRRLTALINNILDFSKIESAEKQYRFCEVDLGELVECTVAAFAMPLRDDNVSIVFHRVGPPTPAAAAEVGGPTLRADKDALGQAIVNLLDNALKYSDGRKEIEVSIVTSPNDVRVSVRDHGIGIAASEQKKIFEKFYRVGSGLVHDVKGSGLGLSIVKHVAEAHGGRVELTSALGEGSTFTIVLPLNTGVILSEAKDPRNAGDPSPSARLRMTNGEKA